jgi:phosphate:Na+ symporter
MLSFDHADAADLRAMHAQVLSDVRLALSILISEDGRGAQELLDAKRRLGEQERAAVREHLGRLAVAGGGVREESALHLALLRDLKRINSYVASIGYAVLEQRPAEPEPEPEPDAVPAEPALP